MFHACMILALAAALLGSALRATPAQARARGTAPAAPVSLGADGKASAAGFLNPDGTLKLDGNFNGALSLDGYKVRIDPQRGPVFAPQSAKAASSADATLGNWADVGGGGSGALNGQVHAIAYVGTDVIVGGEFTDVDNISEADDIAVWDGSSWSAMGSNGYANGALTGTVYALAVDSSDNLYVGGSFFGVYDGSTWHPEASRIAKWDGSHWSALGYGASTSSATSPT
jgi:hypothetical protein